MGKSQLLKDLLKIAKNAQKNAYAPYSKFKVGAALLCKSGKIYTGCNIENISFGLTVCAERVALFKAVSEGVKDIKIMVLTCSSGERIVPCGACLQAFAEFAPNIDIVSINRKGNVEKKKLKTFLKEPFKIDRK